MEAATFSSALEHLTMVDVAAIVRDLDASVATVADEIATTRAIIQVEANLRRKRCRREAAVVGQHAARLVNVAAERDGARMPDPDVIRVARAASQLARGLLVADDVPTAVNRLAAGFQRLLLLPI